MCAARRIVGATSARLTASSRTAAVAPAPAIINGTRSVES